MNLERIFLETAERMAARYEQAAAVEAAVESQMIADAVRENAALPEHYWQARMHAERKARFARQLVEALK